MQLFGWLDASTFLEVGKHVYARLAEVSEGEELPRAASEPGRHPLH